MYRWKGGGKDQKEFPMRFHKMIMDERLFDDQNSGVCACSVICEEQIGGIQACFPCFPQDRVVVSPNGIDMDTFKPAGKDLRTVLKEQTRTILWPAKKGSLWGACTDGDGSAPTEADMEKYKRCVTFVGKAAEWKRQAALLHAAAKYEKEFPDVVTLCVGTGPEDELQKIKDLCQRLNLKNTLLLALAVRTSFKGPSASSSLSAWPA